MYLIWHNVFDMYIEIFYMKLPFISCYMIYDEIVHKIYYQIFHWEVSLAQLES